MAPSSAAADQSPASRVAAVIVAGIGVAGAVGSVRLGLGQPTAPGPGLWPFVVSVVVTGLSVVLIVRPGVGEPFSRSSLTVVVAVGTLVVLALALPLVGFEIPSLVLAFVWLRFLGGESWRASIAISVGAVAAFYLLFVLLLQIPLPRLI